MSDFIEGNGTGLITAVSAQSIVKVLTHRDLSEVIHRCSIHTGGGWCNSGRCSNKKATSQYLNLSNTKLSEVLTYLIIAACSFQCQFSIHVLLQSAPLAPPLLRYNTHNNRLPALQPSATLNVKKLPRGPAEIYHPMIFFFFSFPEALVWLTAK